MKFYLQVDAALKSYEENKPYHPHRMDWIINRIDWCWKWRKITKEQMEELVDRATAVMLEGGHNDLWYV